MTPDVLPTLPVRAPSRRPWALRLAAAALVAAACGAAALAFLHLRDPRRALEATERALARGEPVTLIGATGPPAWYEFRAGQGQTVLAQAGDGTFSAATWTLCLLELLPDPRTIAYRVRLQARHGAGDATGGVGIYVARRASPADPAAPQVFAALSYNDAHPRAELLTNLPELIRKKRKAVQADRAELRVFRYEPGAEPGLRPSGALAGIPFQPAGERAAAPWRDLEVTVTPDKVELSWDGQPYGPVAAERLAEKMARVPGTAFDPRGGLGIYLDHGWATFRNVTVTPLSTSAGGTSP